MFAQCSAANCWQRLYREKYRYYWRRTVVITLGLLYRKDEKTPREFKPVPKLTKPRTLWLVHTGDKLSPTPATYRRRQKCRWAIKCRPLQRHFVASVDETLCIDLILCGLLGLVTDFDILLLLLALNARCK